MLEKESIVPSPKMTPSMQPTILSDIDLHREETLGEATYFEFSGPSSLVKFLSRRPALARALLLDVSDRVTAFASGSVGAVERATQRFGRLAWLLDRLAPRMSLQM